MREVRHPSATVACSSRCSLRPAVGALALAVLLVAAAQVPSALAAPTFTLEDADAALAFPASDTLIALGFPGVGGGSRGIADASIPVMAALVPDHVAGTLSEQPSLFWYIDTAPKPGRSAPRLEGQLFSRAMATLEVE